MKLRATAGRDTEVPQEKVDAFRMRLRGPLLLPGYPDYEESRTVWNAMIDRRPSLVARCRGVAATRSTSPIHTPPRVAAVISPATASKLYLPDPYIPTTSTSSPGSRRRGSSARTCSSG